MHDEIEKLQAELERSQRAIEAIRLDMTAERSTVTSKNRAISVTVDSQGELVEIKFLTRSYRLMPSAELAALLVETIATARREALAKMAALFEAVLPDNIPVLDMINGTLDIDEMMREAVGMAGEWPGKPGQTERTTKP